MKKCIVLLFLIICFATGLRAAESTSPKDYLKKENYEIIEPGFPAISRQNLGKLSPRSFDNTVIASNGLGQCMLTAYYGLDRSPHWGPTKVAIYFDPIAKTFTEIEQLTGLINSGNILDMTDNGQISGKIFNDKGFIWSKTENKVEYFQGLSFARIFNDGSCFSESGYKLDSEGNITKLVGKCFLFANKNGQYPTDEFVANIAKTLDKLNNPFPITIIGYNTKNQLLFGGGNPRLCYISEANGEIHQLKRPTGDRSSLIYAKSINDNGVVAGSLCKITGSNYGENIACLWYENDIFLLNDIFGGSYSEVLKVSDNGDMIVRGSATLGPEKLYLFLRKHSQKADNHGSKKSSGTKKTHKVKNRT